MSKKYRVRISEESNERTNRGLQYIDYFLGQYGDVPINKLGEVISKIRQTKTVLIRWMMNNSGISLERLAKYLGCQPQSLRNKMARDSFDFDDFIICAHACNCSIQIKNNKSINGDDTLVIDAMEYFKGSDPHDVIISRLIQLDNEDLAAKEEEYLRLKEELERMKSEYGFE